MRGWRARSSELALTAGAAAIVALGLLQLQLAHREPWSWRTTLLATTVPCLGFTVHLWLVARRPGADRVLLPTCLCLGGLGLVIVERLRPDLGLRQAAWLLLGLLGIPAGAWLVKQRDALLRYRYSIGAAGLALTAATLIFGVDPNGSGARLWFTVGGISLQPVEALKLLLVIWLAGYLHEHGEVIRLGTSQLGSLRVFPLQYLLPLGFVLILSELLLVIQRDLGAGLLVSLVFVAMIYAATGRITLLLLGLGMLVLAGWLAAGLFSHVALRVSIWLDPWSQSDRSGFQIVQGLIAMANGGILGTGLGLGSPTLVPAVHTDFTIAAIVEELGLAGGLAVLGLYAMLIHRGFRVAMRHTDGYGRLLATGLTAALGIQTLLILGGVLKLLPLTGITLPWMSYGGSSILANALILGMLLGLSSPASGEYA